MIAKKWKVLAVAGMLALAAVGSASAANEAQRTITVSGTGVVEAASDTAVISLSVQTLSADAKNAAKENADTMAAVRNAVIAAGADADGIKTENYSIYPQNSYDKNGKIKDTSYQCTNSMQITVSDLSKTATVMDAAVKAGANQVSSVEFTVKDPAAYQDKALQLAAQDALRRAQVLASAVGSTAGRVISVNVDNYSVVPYRVANLKMSAAADTATPLDPGKSKTESRVTLVVELI